MQDSDQLLIPHAPFKRLIMELTRDWKTDVRHTYLSYFALQTAAESYIINLLKQAYRITLHCKRTTLTIKDLWLAKSVMESFNDTY
jgi:histone H3/H4